MKPDLYICHTAYQVLVEACRAFEASCPPAVLLSAALYLLLVPTRRKVPDPDKTAE